MASAQSKTVTGTSSSVPRLTGCQVGIRIRSKTGKNGVTQRRAVPIFAIGDRKVEHVDTLHWLKPALYEGWDVKEFSSKPPWPTLSLVDEDVHNLRAFKVLASDIAGHCESLGKRDRIVRALRHSSIRQTSKDGEALKLTFPETADATSLKESLRLVFLKGVHIYTHSLKQRGLLDNHRSDPAVIPDGYGGLPSGWREGCPEELQHEVEIRRRLGFYKQKETVDLINEIGELLGARAATIDENLGAEPGLTGSDPGRNAMDNATVADLMSLIKRDPSARTRTWEQLCERIHEHTVQSGAQASQLASTDHAIMATQSASEEAPLTPSRVDADGDTHGVVAPSTESAALRRNAVAYRTSKHRPTGTRFATSTASNAHGGKVKSNTQSGLRSQRETIPLSDNREDVRHVKRTSEKRTSKDRDCGADVDYQTNPHLILADFYITNGEELANRVRAYFNMPLKYGDAARRRPWDSSLDARSTCV